MMMEQRGARRQTLVFAAEVVELSRGASLSARISDISRTGCYVDTLNPVTEGLRVRLRITHHSEVFEVVARVVYVSPGLGMGVVYESMAKDQQARLERWLDAPGEEI